MAITFKVREQKFTTAKGKQTICFAKAISNGETSIEQLQKLIAKISAISEGDVRSVLMTLSQLVALELAEGRIVSLGDLGRLRVGLRSKGGDSKENFRTQDIKRVRTIFVPGPMIRESLYSASLKRQGKGFVAEKCDLKTSDQAKPANPAPANNPEGKEDKDKKDYTGL